MITASELRKRFPAKGGAVDAVRGVSLEVARGEIVGFLGPNGAGKTTTMRMLTTLLPIDGGEATVAGLDVRRQPGQVRWRIGYVSQLGGADELATGRENLILQGRLYGGSKAAVAGRVGPRARAARPVRLRRPPGAHLLRRPAPPAGRRAGHRAPARGAVPGRAEHRPGPAEPGQPVAAHPGAPRAGHHGVPDHALPGRGRRAVRPHHDRRPGPGRRRGHAAGAEAAGGGRRHRAGAAGQRCGRAGRRRAARPARRPRPERGRGHRPAVRHRRRGRAARAAPAARPGRPGGPLARAVRAEPGRRVPAADRPVAARRRPVHPGRPAAGQEAAA